MSQIYSIDRKSNGFDTLKEENGRQVIGSIPTQKSEPKPEILPLIYRVNEIPKWNTALLIGFQQTMICIVGLLVVPDIVSQTVCPGADVVALKVRLISSTFTVTGLSTLIQTTFGYRLAVLQGPSFAFLPPLYAFARVVKCNATNEDYVPPEEYLGRLQIIQGSLACSALFLIIFGASGLIGIVSRRIGPITVCPPMILLCLDSVPIALQKAKLHWISTVYFGLMVIFVLFIGEWKVPIPYFALAKRRIKFVRYRLFGFFPYLSALLITYGVAFILSKTGIEPPNGAARIDDPKAIRVIHESPWFQVPYPGQFGMPYVSLGLFFGMIISCMMVVIESLGNYAILAKVSQEKSPPLSSLNRAIMGEGIGACLAGLLGVGTGVTTYSENIAAVAITRVASRFTMQIASLILIFIGIFTKLGAVFATIPEAMIGGVLSMGLCMLTGIGIALIQSVDLKLSRNVTILGIATIMGMIVPDYFAENPIDVGNPEISQTLNILFNIRQFTGGIVACVLDNFVGGATRAQRGFTDNDELLHSHDNDSDTLEQDGYSFPQPVNKVLKKLPILSKLPFMPSLKRLS